MNLLWTKIIQVLRLKVVITVGRENYTFAWVSYVYFELSRLHVLIYSMEIELESHELESQEPHLDVHSKVAHRMDAFAYNKEIGMQKLKKKRELLQKSRGTERMYSSWGSMTSHMGWIPIEDHIAFGCKLREILYRHYFILW